MKLSNKSVIVILAALLFLIAGAGYVLAGGLSGGSVTPGTATANSIFTFQIRWQDDDGIWPVYDLLDTTGTVEDTAPPPEDPENPGDPVYGKLNVTMDADSPLPIAPYLYGGYAGDSSIRIVSIKPVGKAGEEDPNLANRVGSFTISSDRLSVEIIMQDALPDPGDYVVVFGFSGHKVVDNDATVEADGQTVFLKNTPMENVISVVDGDGNPIPFFYAVRETGRLVLGQLLAPGTHLVVTYWLGPIHVEAGGGIYFMGWLRDSIVDGALFQIRLSAGLNLANKPRGVTGVTYAPSLSSATSDPDHPSRIRNHKYYTLEVAENALGYAEKKVTAANLTIYGSGAELEGITEKVTATELDRLTTSRAIVNVRGVYDSPAFTGTNYFTGGQSSRRIILGTSLPQVPMNVTVRYISQDGSLITETVAATETGKVTTNSAISYVYGVYDNPQFTGINYFIGGEIDAFYLTLGTDLPSAPRDVWVRYTAGAEVRESVNPGSVSEVVTSNVVTHVFGVYDNANFSGTNYFIGGEFDSGSYAVTLGTPLPQVIVDDPNGRVWVRYETRSSSRYGGVAGQDRLGWRTLSRPWQKSIPLWPELSPEFPCPDPLDYEEAGHIDPSPYDPTAPNEGSGNTAFVFKVRYFNSANLPPLPWLPWNSTPANYNHLGQGYSFNPPSGVVLFLDALGTGDYKPYFMQKSKASAVDYNTNFGCEYIYRIEPASTWGSWVSGDNITVTPPYWPINNLYESLQLGRYHYYFACSDDYIFDERGADPNYYYPNDRVFPVGDSRWVQRHNIPYDPGIGSGYTGNYNRIDNHCYIDARTLQHDPSHYIGEYYPAFQYAADRYPVVYPLLAGMNRQSEALDYGRFLETLSPQYNMANPVYAYPSHPAEGAGGHSHAQVGNARSSGGTTSTVYTFRVIYKSKNPGTGAGIQPTHVKLFINDASDYGTAAERVDSADPHFYREYVMTPAPGQQQPYDYANGVIYQIVLGNLQLKRGPHTYYFEAYDGTRRTRLPIRPDGRVLTNADGSNWRYWEDAWVPGSLNANDNDYFPGPYINTAPTITNTRVTPASGPQSTNFKFEATYSDADGQRPYYLDVLIQTVDGGTEENGGVVRGRMLASDPSNQDYKNGVNYYLDLRTLVNVTLQPGNRRFKFEARDDWGDPKSIFEKIQGEKVLFPAGGDNWIDGPQVEFERAPRLTEGSVTSSDGTSTTATLWNYRVKYTHGNDTAPSYVNVYIGKRTGIATSYSFERYQPLDERRVRVMSTPVTKVTGVWTNKAGTGTNYYSPTGSFDPNSGVISLAADLPDATKDVYVTYEADPITWDGGHAMSKVDAGNIDYADGVNYIYQSRLAGPQAQAEAGFRYVYAFEASDGTRSAVYNPVADPAGTELSRRANSPWAHAVIGQEDPYVDTNGNGVWDDGEEFVDQNGNGVHDSGPESFTDMNGNELYDLGEDFDDVNGNGVYDIGGETLTTDDQLKYFFEHSMLCGPLPLAEPIDPGVIDGPRLFKNGVLLMPDSRVTWSTPPQSDRKIIKFPYGEIARIISIKSTSTVDPQKDYYGGSSLSWYEYSAGVTTIHLGTDAIPTGANAVIDFVWKGDYSVDYVNGIAAFHQPNAESDIITANYWFTETNSQLVGYNSPPTLSLGSVTPTVGGPNDDFIFRVTFKDTDGTNGQAPAYVRVCIDGVFYNMTRVNVGAPNYRDGERYQFITKLVGGAHRYRFEASDGSGYAVFDKNGGRSSVTAIGTVEDIPGPYVNGVPLLREGRIEPVDTVSLGDAVTYYVIYTDEEGDAPNSGYPKVWIDNPNEVSAISYTVGSIDGATSTITVTGTPNWPSGSLINKLVQFTSGTAASKVYVVSSNTENTLTLAPDSVVDAGVAVADSLIIGAGTVQAGMSMTQRLPSQTSYRTQTVSVTGPGISEDGATLTVSRSVVSGVIGVYLTQTPGLDDVNYFTDGAYDFETGVITLGTPLPDDDDDGVVDAETVFVQHGMAFSLVVPSLPEGQHAYHFSSVSTVSIGGTPVDMSARLPSELPSPTELPGPLVEWVPPLYNEPPILSGGSVTPGTGNLAGTFSFSVIYTDANDTAPALGGYVRLRVDGAKDFAMTYQSGVYRNGAVYSVNVPAGQLPLLDGSPYGAHSYQFLAHDGLAAATPTAIETGPTVLDEPVRPTHRISVVQPSGQALVGKVDMVCPPVLVADVRQLFMKYPDSQSGDMWIADQLYIHYWSPLMGDYLSPDDGDFPTLTPGMAFFIRPKTPKFWSGGNDYLLEAFGVIPSQSEDVRVTLHRGWNQFGSVFSSQVNWSDVRVIYQDRTMTLAEAGQAGHIRDYAWGWNTNWEPFVDTNGNGVRDQGEPYTDWNGNLSYDGPAYFLVHSTHNTQGVRRALEPWVGYWIRCMVDELQLLIPAPGARGVSSPTRMPLSDKGTTDNMERDVTEQPVPVVSP